MFGGPNKRGVLLIDEVLQFGEFTDMIYKCKSAIYTTVNERPLAEDGNASGSDFSYRHKYDNGECMYWLDADV